MKKTRWRNHSSSPEHLDALKGPISFALKGAVERELDQLENLGILDEVTHSQWASPTVPVPKTDGHLRLCGDYKATLNPEFDVDQYPLPWLSKLFVTLSGGKKFRNIDLTSAYQQLMLERNPDSWSPLICIVNCSGTLDFLLESHQPQLYSRRWRILCSRDLHESSATLMTS